MTKKTAWLFGGGTLLGLLLAGLAILAIPLVEDKIVTSFIEHHLLNGNKALLKDDGLQVLLCGTSAPFADPNRAQNCTAIIAGGRYYLVDAGPGSGRNLELWQLRGRELASVFLTHFHSDHIGDLGEINTNAWLAGHSGSLQVYGGPGVERVVHGFNEAYGLDGSYRTANAGPKLLPLSEDQMQPNIIQMQGASTPGKDRTSMPMHFGEMVVTAIEVNHDPAEPAYGYRFDYRGRSVVISGDTKYHPPLAKAAKGADVLVHEAQSLRLVQIIQKAASNIGDRRIAQTMVSIQHYHTDPLDAARIANQANVRLLVLTHLNPPPSNFLLYHMFYRGIDKARSGKWLSGEDGTLITLPIGSKEIDVSTIHP